jgi:hypothetical protein
MTAPTSSATPKGSPRRKTPEELTQELVAIITEKVPAYIAACSYPIRFGSIDDLMEFTNIQIFNDFSINDVDREWGRGIAIYAPYSIDCCCEESWGLRVREDSVFDGAPVFSGNTFVEYVWEDRVRECRLILYFELEDDAVLAQLCLKDETRGPLP